MRFTEVIVWQKAHALALKTIRAADSAPSSQATRIVMAQLVKAATSIGANIAEGHGRHLGKEYAHHLQIAYGSANELENWLVLAQDAGFLAKLDVQELRGLSTEVMKMLSAMLQTLSGRQGIAKLREDLEEYLIP